MINKEAIKTILSKVKKDSRDTLLENEVYEILKQLNINTPHYRFVPYGQRVDTILKDGGSEVVVKVVSPEILHKTELGGVLFCRNDVSEINKAIEIIGNATAKYSLYGFIVVEKVPYSSSFGNELIVSMRNSSDFGTTVGFGVGGIDTEFFGKRMQNAFTVISGDRREFSADLIKNNAAYFKTAGLDRTRKKLCDDKEILSVLESLAELGRTFSEESDSEPVITELELNPVVISNKKLVAIDALMKFKENVALRTKRPLKKLDNLFHPKSIAILGVSQKSMNMGRIILNNIINRNFDKSKLFVVKADTNEIDGVKCVPSIKDLSEKVDLLVLALNASETATVMKEIIDYDIAESVIVIPGGFAEKEGGEDLEQGIVNALQMSRKLPGEGPILVGGNCLGVISNPGSYDTFFIPDGKIEYSTPLPYAFISQSGAFVISKISKTDLTPQYAVSIGNQMDLTFSDYLSYFKNMDNIKVVAGYIEGFKNLDGTKTVRIIRELRAKGKDVLIYKGGRSSEGKTAASGHTASIAGEYSLFRSMMKDAGALVAENFVEFEDFLKLAVCFCDLKNFGTRLSLISNAGFETVGMADNIEGATLAQISDATKAGITELLVKGRIDKLVTAKNPLDVTPVANDEIYTGCTELMLADHNTDAVVVSCVPMSPSLKSAGAELSDESSMFKRLNPIFKASTKPFIVVVDSGKLYDAASSVLKGMPVFRESDRAVTSLIEFLAYKGGK